MEEWRAIPGYEGHYEISSKGRVRSLDRMVPCAGGQRLLKGREILPFHDKAGYCFIRLFGGKTYGTGKGGRIRRRRAFHIARLVLTAFIGPPPSPFHEACHSPNPDPSCNCLTNLSWGSKKDNMHGWNNFRERGPDGRYTTTSWEPLETDPFLTGETPF